MPLVSVKEVSFSFGGLPLLEQINLQIDAGERVCLLGRNGTGKTTLMSLINGDLAPDEGTIARQQDARIARLEQQVPQDVQGTNLHIVTRGLGERGQLLAEYHAASRQVADNPGSAAMQRLDRLHRQLDAQGGWQLHIQVERVLTHLQVDPEAEFTSLSGGQKRRVLLARALVGEPDLLLLDEPTNHLDIESIEWLEQVLLTHIGALLLVTHDRTFLKKVATRVVELDRARLYNWNCDYATFAQRKEQALGQERHEQELFVKKLAQEETWLHQGTQARTTRNQGRVKALQTMRQEHTARRTEVGRVRMRTQRARRTGKLVIEAEDIAFSYGDRPLIRQCTTTIMRGDKVGVIGANGSGKTTLLRLLLGDLAPKAGQLRHGTHLQVAYFDQMREQLDPEGTVQDNINDGNPILTIDGRPQHVIGYLRNFLFSADQVNTRVKDLSGGERTRLMLARLFARPFNVLVMDEPTNDLDLETLELLEKLLIDYRGTLLLVSHDRALLNNVVNKTLALEGDGQVNEYAGGYDDWLWQRMPQPAEQATSQPASKPKPKPGHLPEPGAPRKIKFEEKRELETLPGRIEALEAEQRQLYESMADPALYQRNGAQITQIQRRLATLESELEEAYERWAFLDGLVE